jgi:hypothetical protein
MPQVKQMILSSLSHLSRMLLNLLDLAAEEVLEFEKVLS